MTKKAGALPVWAWVAIVAVGGYLFYRYRKNAEATPEVEGYYPAEHREPNEGEPTASGAGMGAVEEAREARQEAGEEGREKRQEAGEEGRATREYNQETEREERHEREERRREEKGEPAPVGKGGKGKGKTGAKGKGKGKGGKGKRAPKHTAPAHTHQPAHTPARHPKTRIGLGQARPVVTAKQSQRRAKQNKRRRG